MVDHPPLSRKLPSDNWVGNHDFRSGARSYYDSVDFGEVGHTRAVAVQRLELSLGSWKRHIDVEHKMQGDFIGIYSWWW